MARYYKSGRSRTVRVQVIVTVSVAWKGAASAPGGLIGVGSDYTTVLTDPTTGGGLNMSGQSSAFGVRGAVGFKATGGDPFVQTIALGVQVPSLTDNGFVPLALATFGGSVTATATISRVMQLTEVFDHAQNGKRLDLYGPSGTCYETYTVDGHEFTSAGDGEFVPGQIAGDGLGGSSTPSYFPRGLGILTRASATSQKGGLGSGAFDGGDIAVVWSLKYLDADGNSLFEDPDAPTTSSIIGLTSWGRVQANACAGAGRHTAYADVQFLPRHAYDIRMEPRSLPSGAPVSRQHRLQIEWRNSVGTVVPASGFDYDSSGETATITCGGTKWDATHSSTVSGETGLGRVVAYNSFLPLINRVQVTTDDAIPHFYAHVRGPWNGMELAQAGAINVPGGGGLSVPVGTQTLTVADEIGYRWLRVTAKTPSGTGSLAISTYLNGNTTTATATETLTTTSAGVSVTVEIDMLTVVGSTFDAQLRLEEIRFVASGATFTVETVELFRKVENTVQVLSSRRGLFPLAMPFVLPWVLCYTDGVESLRQSISGNSTTGAITVLSLTIRQLVAEINGTTRHNYSGWSTMFPHTPVIDAGGSATTPGPLMGWTATELSAPRVGKGYSADELYEPEDWKDSDAYLPALHGDGIVGSALQLVEPTGTLQAQRFAQMIEPGILPGSAGFDGTDGEEFGVTQDDQHRITPIRFVALLRGLAHGNMLGEQKYLPVRETADILVGGGTTPITPPVPVGTMVPRSTGSGFCFSGQGLKGQRTNGYKENTIDNAGGTNATEVVAPYNRDRQYVRLWTDAATEPSAIEHDPARAWIHLAEGLKVTTYGYDMTPLFSGEDLAVDEIRRLKRVQGGRLLVLAVVGSAAKVYESGDGGRTVTEILSMTNAASSLVEYDPARNWILVFWEDATSHQIYRRISRDGGASWESAVAVQWTPTGGSIGNLVGELMDIRRVGELAGRLMATVKVSSVGKAIQSGDGGLTWSQVL